MTSLTKREKEITVLVWEDFSNKEIAKHLNIAESTIENHLHNIFEKLSVKTRMGLVKKAMEIGVIAL